MSVGPPTVAEVVDYLGDQAPRNEGVLVGAYYAEKAAQQTVCNVPLDTADWPADLREALCRRVARNIAMRGLPLGLQPLLDDSGAAVRVGRDDPEVRRLEAPYRKRKVA